MVAISIAVDRVFYGRWMLTPLRFLQFNVVRNLSLFYGGNPWHWYVSQAMPVILLSFAPVFLAVVWGALRVCDTSESHARAIVRAMEDSNAERTRSILQAIGWVVAVYSCLGHKEFRFIYPVLPLVLVLCGRWCTRLGSLADWWSSLRRVVSANQQHHYKDKLKTPARTWTAWQHTVFSLLILPQLIFGWYMTQWHQRGVLDVMHWLRDETVDAVTPRGILVLMPCHSVPHTSYIQHDRVWIRMLTCEPPLLPGETLYVLVSA